MRCPCENPTRDETLNALLALGGTIGGIGLILWLLRKAGDSTKVPLSPATSPSPPIIRTTVQEQTYYVYSQLVDGMDTPQARCTLPLYVYSGTYPQALSVARQLTSQAPRGASGTIAVVTAGPANFDSGKCWRRTCFPDGTCVGTAT